MHFRRIAVLLMILLLTAGLSLAQTSKGMLSGTITDPSGAVVSGATVTAASTQLGESRTVTTGPTGTYRFEAINPGTYKVTVAKQGFTTLIIDKVEVVASIITPLDARLKVGGTVEQVTVEATGSEINTQSGELSGNISNVEITSLPLSSLNPIQLVLTQPGITDGGGHTYSEGFSFSVNGQSARNNNFLIDGQDNNDNAITGQAFQPINGAAISEVTIMTNSYQAEFGRAGASVTNVIYKGGTNAFHGNVWELYTGSGLNAVKAQDALSGQTGRDKPRYDDHTFGFAIGGPIVKNKLFAFGSSQWYKFYGMASPSTIYAPTAAGAAVLQSLGSANANLLLQYYGSMRAPVANTTYALGGGRPGVQFGNAQRAPEPKQNPDLQWNLKLDFLPTQRDSFGFRYFHDRGSLVPDFYNFPNSLPGFDTLQGGPSENVGLNWTHTFNPHAVNEFRASWGHFDYQFKATPEALANPLYLAPRLSLGISKSPLFGVSTALPQGRGHQTYQFQNATTITKGSHVFKFGFDIAMLRVLNHVPMNFFGSESYASGGGFTALANFVDNYTGNGGSAAKTFGNPVDNPHALQQAFYLQDNWKLKSNLSINYGLRYEFQPNPGNYLSYPGYDTYQGPFSNMLLPVKIKEDINNFGPRVGFAYTPGFFKGLFGEDKTVLRGGFGIYYDPFYTNMLDNTQASAPNSVAQLVTGVGGRGLSNAYAQVSLMTPVLNPNTASQTSQAANTVNPQSYQWNLDIQRELPGAMTMTVAYVGVRGLHQFESEYLNPRQGYDMAASYAAETLKYIAGGARVNPNRGTITVRESSGSSIYHGFNAKVERRFSKGLFMRAAYTFGKVIDNGSDPWSLGDVYSVVPQNPACRACERGLAAQDLRQRFVITYVYQIPGFHWSGNGFTKGLSYVTRNWEISGTTSMQTGVPGSLYAYGYDITGTGYTSNGRPFMGNPSAPLDSVGFDGLFVGGTPGVLYNWDTEAVTTANDVHWVVRPGFGNVGRNTYTNPGMWNFNTAFVRHVPMPFNEKHQLNFRAEFYNLFNHPNEDNWVTTDMTAGKGTFMDAYQAREGGREVRLKIEYVF